MGRRRNGIIEQSQKKPKIFNRNSIADEQRFYFAKNKKGGKEIIFLPEDVVAEMKRLNPRELANILLPNDVKTSAGKASGS